jgi:hypothetical protein
MVLPVLDLSMIQCCNVDIPVFFPIIRNNIVAFGYLFSTLQSSCQFVIHGIC